MSEHLIAVFNIGRQDELIAYQADCSCGWVGPEHRLHGSFPGQRHGGDPYKDAAVDAYEHQQAAKRDSHEG